jgi:putative GTP pyrophosphokinase
MIAGFQIIEKQIHQKIVDELNKVGLLYRIFVRTKNEKSISEKIQRKIIEGKPYNVNGKKIQDAIGVRVVTYFKDDLSVVKEILNNKFKFIGEEIDEMELTVFKPKRTNIICQFDTNQILILKEVNSVSKKLDFNLIDNTFELQLRTMLSEGWYEIDHSLRYKCKDDWKEHKESERLLNGIYASLETNDIALKNLFNELSYQHFKNKNWEALLRNKFRLQFQLSTLKSDLITILNNDNSIGKRIIKIDRTAFLLKISELDLSLPVNFNNLLYLINVIEIKNEKLLEKTPEIIITAANKELR